MGFLGLGVSKGFQSFRLMFLFVFMRFKVYGFLSGLELRVLKGFSATFMVYIRVYRIFNFLRFRVEDFYEF